MFKNNLCYEASAGSGKTFMLVVRYLSLLFKGADSSKILALTFTNKAASEMSERIVETLEELENRGELEEISSVSELSREYLLENRKRVLEEFLNSATKIMTIDSFFTQILRKFSLYASLMPDFTTFTSQHELKLMSRFLSEVNVAKKRDTLITLSLQSKKRLGDIFALLDEFYIKKEELSRIKFTREDLTQYEVDATAAFYELKKIVESCDSASSTVLNAVQADSFEEIYTKSWIGRETLNYRTFSKCFTPEMDSYLEVIQNSVKEYHRAKEQNFFHSLGELVDIYEKSKKALYMDDSELSFSDVTSLVYQILNFLDDSEFLYFRLDAQIEHMLLDEFQDTSILQYEILKPLIQEITSGEGIFSDGSFFFVGDVKQSIYRFRGGVSSLFAAVVKEHDTKVEKLLMNYRSQKHVIDFINSSFKTKIDNYTEQLVRAEASGGYVEIVQNDELLEETLIQVKRVIELGANLNDIAILCATNGDGEAIKIELQKEGVEVVTETTTKLINQQSVKAILEYLKYLYFDENIYKYNFFALIDQKIRDINSIDFNSVKLVDIVKSVIDEYKLFSDDFHLIRFLNSVSKYPDIEALLFEYERLDTAAAASDLSGVRVLTIHKSEGLEYEHVIVMDRLKKAPPARNSIIYEYDGIELKNVYLRTKGRDALDREYENALSKEKLLVREDNLNALYVAFTRARRNLFIIHKLKDSAFSELELNAGKFGKLESSREDNKQISKDELQSLEYTSLYYGTQSDILALEREDNEDLDAINFGLAMHFCLEMMSEFTLDKLTNASYMTLNKFGYSLNKQALSDIQNRVTNLMKDEEFIELSNGECYREKAIRYKNNLRYIDLLVQREDGGWNVIDYKSSFAYSKQHLKQVSYYVRAIKEITGDVVDGYICYLLEDEIKTVKV